MATKLALIQQSSSFTSTTELDDKLGAKVIPLTSPFALFFKPSDVAEGAGLIRFVIYNQGRQRLWMWGMYNVKDDVFTPISACKYGTPGASLASLDKAIYYQGFEDMANTTKNRIIEIRGEPNLSAVATNFFERMVGREGSREELTALTSAAARSMELDPETPYYLNVYLSQLAAANVEQAAYLRNQSPDIFTYIYVLDPMFSYKHTQAVDRCRLYTYYLGVLDGKIDSKDLKEAVLDDINKLLRQDVHEVTNDYVAFMRSWVAHYQTAINLLTITYSDMKKLQPSQRLVVEKMTLSFGKWMRGGALYRPELVDNLETCPSAAACEILSQQSPPEPLCQIYTFGVEEAEEARLQ